jgi:pimeloyl-ACP methyl ester carboxylesterase
MHLVLAGVILAALVAVLYVGAAVFATAQAVGEHPEWRIRHAEPERYGLAAETVRFASRDGIALVAWWIGAPTPRGTVVLLHGSGTNRTAMLPRAAFLVRSGWSVLAVDLRAHGESGGNYLSPGYVEAADVLGAVDHLVERAAPRPFVVLGHSYGAVAAIEAAARSDEIAAVISDSGFVSVSEQMDRSIEALNAMPEVPGIVKASLALRSLPGLGPLNALVFRLRTGASFDFERATVLPSLAALGGRPVLAIGGAKDKLAPPEFARRIREASSSPASRLAILEGAGHGTYSGAPDAYESAVGSFLDLVERTERSRSLAR